ncbi:LLM class flavin-dependent oxidoreductase [Streptomyces morookaense]|uniref:LLM class flavin-dependent oxidoreductase n=1 Tax=Streptomyces morookaense TaxID=1970 RepID=UPI0033D04775
MRTGVVILPEHPWPEAREIWQAAEEAGFDHAWTYDHLTWRSLRDAPWFGSVPLLAAVAAVTRRIRIGPLVATPNFRHPVVLAKELMTLDHIAGGRLTAGIGAGADGFDARALGGPALPPGARTRRFEEFVTLLDRLLRHPATEHDGPFYTARAARTVPGCVQQPRIPFAIAAAGPRGMRLAARYGQAWVTAGDPARPGRVTGPAVLPLLARQARAVDEACARAVRDPASLDRIVLGSRLVPDLTDSADRLTAFAAGCAALGFTDLVLHRPRPSGVFAGKAGTFDAVVAAALPHIARLRPAHDANGGTAGGDGPR